MTHSVTFLSHEWHGPSEHIHEVGQPVRMFYCVELADIHHIVLVFQHGSFVPVHVKVIGGREDGD